LITELKVSRHKPAHQDNLVNGQQTGSPQLGEQATCSPRHIGEQATCSPRHIGEQATCSPRHIGEQATCSPRHIGEQI
jgi:hypothetical protein